MYKILFFGKLPPPYIGPAIATKIIINSGLSREFKLVHFNTSHHSDISQLSKKSIKNIAYPFFQYLKLLFYLIYHSPHAVYIPSQQSTIGYIRDIPYIIISKLLGKKVICHLRGGYFKNWYNESNSIMQYIIRQIQKMVDGQIVLGENLRGLFNFLMPEEKIFVIPNGADFPQFKKNNSKQNFSVLFLGNFIKSKGIIDVLNAAVLLEKEGVRDIKFYFAGNWMDEKTRTEFYKLKNSEKLNNIEVLGQVTGNKKYELLAKMDIFVFPTHYRNEGHPWVIVEAMAQGLPIITTDHGAIVESVYNNINGFIVEKNKPKEIANNIVKLINDKKLLNDMGIASKKIYRAKFTEKVLVQNFSFVFNKVINHNI